MSKFNLLSRMLLAWVLLTPIAWSANPANQVLVGKGIYKALFWDIYQAELFAEKKPWQHNQAYSLRLTYFRNFDGKSIAERSIEEMRGLGFQDESKLQEWLQTMLKIFPDVQKGESITGVRQASGATEFFKNNQKIGWVEDPEFGRWFFGIWLDEKTSAPDLRVQLLGES